MIAVQVGQTGNQLGFDMYDSFYNHLRYSDHSECMSSYFREVTSGVSKRWISRSVWIDTNPTTLDSCIEKSRQSRTWCLDERCTESGHVEIASNWAKGYQEFTGSFQSNSLDHIRRELERVDVHTTLMVIHSVGGGSGSGIGTHITEVLVDEFPGTSKVNLAIMPKSADERTLEHYNAVLCLSKLAAVTDAVLLFDNEVMSDLCMEMSGKKVPSVQEMNQAIVHNLVPALLPKYQAQRLTSGASRHPAAAHGIADSSAFRAYGRYSSHTQRFWGRDHEEKWQRVDDESSVPLGHAAFPIPLTRDVAHLCGHPNYKFVDVKYAPQISDKSEGHDHRHWRGVLQSLQRMDAVGSASVQGTQKNTVVTSAVFAGWPNERPILKFDPRNDYNMLYMQTLASCPSLPRASYESTVSSPVSEHSGGVTGLSAGAVEVHHPPSKLSNTTDSCRATRLVRSISFLDEYVEDNPTHHGRDYDDSKDHEEKITAKICNIASCLTLLGAGAQRAAEDVDTTSVSSRDGRVAISSGDGLQFSSRYESWVKRSYESSSPSLACKVSFSTIKANGYERSASIMTNGQSIIPILQRPVVLGTKMFRVGAYVHQYTSAGLDQDDLVSSFRSVQRIVNNYRDLR